MRNTILLLLLVLTLPISAQDENSALFRELTDAMCLNQRERLWMIDYMTHWSNSTLTIDGVEYLTSYNPLALVSDSLEHLSVYDGILGEDVEEAVTVRDSWGDRPDTGDSYCCTWALDNKHLFLTGIYRQGWKKVDDVERVYINKRMEDFTGCKFVGNRMFLSTLSGTLYVKAVNTESKPNDIGTYKREIDFPEYVRWLFEPLYRLTFKNGKLVSREELICCDGVDFEQGDLSVEEVIIYQEVDTLPVFLNEMKVMEYIHKETNYPKECQEQEVEGLVVVQFVVNIDGSVSDIHLVKPAHPMLDAEACRVVSTMSNWKPGLKNGKVVRSYVVLPIHFKLTGSDNLN